MFNKLEHKAELAEQHTIKRIVCSGGGAKGVSYLGAYAALEDSGILQTVEEVAGASIGSIISAFMALGISKHELRKVLFSANAAEWFGPRAQRNQEGVVFITRNGRPLELFIRNTIISILKNKLQHLKSDDPRYLQIKAKIESESGAFTFSDLAVLREIFPREFKSLAVNAVNARSGDVQIFDAKRTPNVEIAMACRASSSVPILLEPVKININGREEVFVDGGLYDNLPTDCFDDEDREEKPAQKHIKLLQTLVFAFSDSIVNESNEVFKALYGHRWDDVVTQDWLENVIRQAYEQEKEKITTARFEVQRVNYFMQGLKSVLNESRKKENFLLRQINSLVAVFKNFFYSYLTKQGKGYRYFAGDGSRLGETRFIKSLARKIKGMLRPVLYNPSYLEVFAYDYLVKAIGKVKANFKNTDQKEKMYQRVRAQYALRTVPLHSVSIQAHHFAKADKAMRVMSMMGYLDTINHISNHELQDANFDTDLFYRRMGQHFLHTYEAILLGAGVDFENHAFARRIKQFIDKAQGQGLGRNALSRELIYMLKDHVERDINSVEAFALTRALEFTRGGLSADDLFKEVYEKAFSLQGVFSQSKITGHTIFSRSKLHHVLAHKSMFRLFQAKHPPEVTRTHKIFTALSKMQAFERAYHQLQAKKIRHPS